MLSSALVTTREQFYSFSSSVSFITNNVLSSALVTTREQFYSFSSSVSFITNNVLSSALVTTREQREARVVVRRVELRHILRVFQQSVVS